MANLLIVHYYNAVEPRAYTSVNDLLKFLNLIKRNKIESPEGKFDYSDDHIKQLVRTCYQINRSFVCKIDDKLSIFIVSNK